MSFNPNQNGGSGGNRNPLLNSEYVKLMPVSKSVFITLAVVNIVSMVYSPLYYYLSNIPYFVTYSQYEIYRVFTSVFVDSFSLSFILSALLSPFVASYVERRDGSILLVYRMILITVLENILFALLSWPILKAKPLWGFLLKMSGFGDMWTVFVMIEVFRNPDILQVLRTNCFAMAMAVIFLLSSLFSVSSLVVLIVVLLLHFIPGLYTPRKTIAAFVIPFPAYRKLQAIDDEEKAKRKVTTPTPPSTRQTIRPGQPVTISSLATNQPDEGLSTIRQGSQMFEYKKPDTDKKVSRFQGNSHILGGTI